jgi:glycosyltransferase involved in cell wall biosynthesis
MLFGDDTLIEAVDDRVRSSPTLSEHVTLVGRSSRDEIPNYYGAADIFISGSHSEGSGYALVESMAAGVIPVVTDIPSHRAIAGDAGALWPAGAAAACARALLQVCATNLTEQKKRVLERYQAVLRWDAIATKTIREYQSLVEAKRAATS